MTVSELQAWLEEFWDEDHVAIDTLKDGTPVLFLVEDPDGNYIELDQAESPAGRVSKSWSK